MNFFDSYFAQLKTVLKNDLTRWPTLFDSLIIFTRSSVFSADRNERATSLASSISESTFLICPAISIGS